MINSAKKIHSQVDLINKKNHNRVNVINTKKNPWPSALDKY